MPQVCKQIDVYRRLHLAIRHLEINSLSTVYAWNPLESPPTPPGEDVAQFEDICPQLVTELDLGSDTSTSILVLFFCSYMLFPKTVDLQNYLQNIMYKTFSYLEKMILVAFADLDHVSFFFEVTAGSAHHLGGLP